MSDPRLLKSEFGADFLFRNSQFMPKLTEDAVVLRLDKVEKRHWTVLGRISRMPGHFVPCTSQITEFEESCRPSKLRPGFSSAEDLHWEFAHVIVPSGPNVNMPYNVSTTSMGIQFCRTHRKGLILPFVESSSHVELLLLFVEPISQPSLLFQQRPPQLAFVV